MLFLRKFYMLDRYFQLFEFRKILLCGRQNANCLLSLTLKLSCRAEQFSCIPASCFPAVTSFALLRIRASASSFPGLLPFCPEFLSGCLATARRLHRTLSLFHTRCLWLKKNLQSPSSSESSSTVIDSAIDISEALIPPPGRYLPPWVVWDTLSPCLCEKPPYDP